MSSYHNTTNSFGNALDRYEDCAKNQEQYLLHALKHSLQDLWTPSQVWDRLFNCHVPLTSIRRAMTNLTEQGHLIKTDRQLKGLYGRPEYCWKLADTQGELFDGN